jgi:hypothetical protein
LQAYHELMAENKQAKEKFQVEIQAMEKRCDDLKNNLISSHQSALSDASKLHEQQMMGAITEAESQLAKMKKVRITVKK